MLKLLQVDYNASVYLIETPEAYEFTAYNFAMLLEKTLFRALGLKCDLGPQVWFSSVYKKHYHWLRGSISSEKHIWLINADLNLFEIHI